MENKTIYCFFYLVVIHHGRDVGEFVLGRAEVVEFGDGTAEAVEPDRRGGGDGDGLGDGHLRKTDTVIDKHKEI